MLRAVLFFMVMLATVLVSPAQTLATDKRVALVIGNSAYQFTPQLANPKNDAEDLATALEKLGFHVISGFDLDKSAMDRLILEFARALSGAEVGLFYYAGHGLQVEGQNYLVPVDAKLADLWSLDFEMVKADLVQRTMERATRTNLIFLDACRDNPLSRNLARALGTRSASIGKGLAALESGEGTLISFSTQPGSVAADGQGRNSPYAAALVHQLLAPRDDLSSLLIQVRNEVIQETGRRQVPWEHSALTARFYFAAPSAVSAATPAPDLEKGARELAVALLDKVSSGMPDGPMLADEVRLGRRGMMTRREAIAELGKLKSRHKDVKCVLATDQEKSKPAQHAGGGIRIGVSCICDFTEASGETAQERFPLEIEVSPTSEGGRISGMWAPDKMVLWEPRAK